MKIKALVLISLFWTGSAVAINPCNCNGYSGVGGPCYDGVGGPAYAGVGGPAYSGVGGPCYSGVGGPCYAGVGGGWNCPSICK